ncbi:hypothetical protein KY289_030369 [Solanum tuberosum]|nr:hypothetical protein KY289_030369 [Solanum tuberosum]
MSLIASDLGYYDMGCVKGLDTKRIDFPIFEGRRDPEAYLDWEWQFEQIFQRHDLRTWSFEKSCIGLVYSRGKAPDTPRKYPPIDMGRIEEADEVQECAKKVQYELHHSRGGSLLGTTSTTKDISIHHGGM